jgi:DNA helicase-2/ATP-dependent DNA helicase PcrA
LEKVFKHIYIDEVQDMAGWDLELIRLILRSTISLTMVGDPRQTVYLTHHDDKHQKYKYGKIKEFIQEKCTRNNEYCCIDTETLRSSYRNIEQICILSSKLYPSISACSSSLTKTNPHIGIYFVHMCEVEKYYTLYKPIQLRLRKDVELPIDVPSMTFGMSKGLEAEHVLIYPTTDMLKWLCGQKINFAPKTKAQLYVALTRAFFSVGIVVDDDFNKKIDGITIWRKKE